MSHKSLLKSGLHSGDWAAPGEGPQVLPGTALPALLLGVWGKGPLGFIRD